MSAEVYTEHVYNGYCPDCNAGSDADGLEEAEAWVEEHNQENHA